MHGRAVTAWEALTRDLADAVQPGLLTHAAVRLTVAALVGAVLGYQRQRVGKAAGLRTHMLVSVGAAFFVLVPQLEGASSADLSRVVQGIVTGIGFIGAGTILKLTEAQQVRGLTTAAGIWLTAAAGTAAGFGRLGSALLVAALGLLILAVLGRLERAAGQKPSNETE